MEPPSQHLFNSLAIINQSLAATDYITIGICLLTIVFLVPLSTMIASSDNPYFSLSNSQSEELTSEKSLTSECASYLSSYPKKLLATIRIGNTFVNRAVVMVSGLMFEILFDVT